MSQTTMSIRVDSNLKQRFDTICDEVGLNTTSALVVFKHFPQKPFVVTPAEMFEILGL